MTQTSKSFKSNSRRSFVFEIIPHWLNSCMKTITIIAKVRLIAPVQDTSSIDTLLITVKSKYENWYNLKINACYRIIAVDLERGEMESGFTTRWTLSCRREYRLLLANGRRENLPETRLKVSRKAWYCSDSRFRSFSNSAKLSSCVNANWRDMRSAWPWGVCFNKSCNNQQI